MTHSRGESIKEVVLLFHLAICWSASFIGSIRADCSSLNIRLFHIHSQFQQFSSESNLVLGQYQLDT